MVIEKYKFGYACDPSEFNLWDFRPRREFFKVRRQRSLSVSDINDYRKTTSIKDDSIFPKRTRCLSENDAENYEQSRFTSFKKTNGNPLVHLVAGSFAGAVASYSTHWLDTVKVQMQCCPQLYSNSVNCLSTTWRTEGIHGLYRGAFPAVFSHTSKTGITFMSYGLCEQLMCKVLDFSSPDELMLLHHASIGGFTGILNSLFLCPLEVVKCRLQVDSHSNSSPYRIIKNLHREEGFRGFYRGLSCLWIKEIPGSFIYFGSYECAKHFNRICIGGELDSKSTFLCGCWTGFCFCILHPIETVKSRIQVAEGVGDQYRGFIKTTADIIKNEGVCLLCSGIKPCIARSVILSGLQFTVYEYTKKSISGRGLA